jgi:hypothetical protein
MRNESYWNKEDSLSFRQLYLKEFMIYMYSMAQEIYFVLFSNTIL